MPGSRRPFALAAAALALAAVLPAVAAPAATTCGVTKSGVTTYPLPQQQTHMVGFTVDPTKKGHLYVADNSTVYTTTDNGCSWRALWTLAGSVDKTSGIAGLDAFLGDSIVEMSRILPSAPRSFYLLTMEGRLQRLLRTTDGGETFVAADNGLFPVQVTCWAYSPVSPTTVYAAYAGGNIAKVYATTDGGASWAERYTYSGFVHGECPIAAGIDGAPSLWLGAAHPGDFGAATAATGEKPYEGLYHSRDGGRTVSAVPTTGHPGQRIWLFAAGRGTRGSTLAYVSADANYQDHLWVSDDDGAHVREVTLPLTSLGCLVASPTTGDVFLSTVGGDYSIGYSLTMLRLKRGARAFTKVATRSWTVLTSCGSTSASDGTLRAWGSDLWSLQAPGAVVDENKGNGGGSHEVPDVLVRYTVK
jgi:hypothetical protein